MQSAEASFRNESRSTIEVEREVQRVRVADDLADAFGVSPGTELFFVVTKASEGGRPVSISDTYQIDELFDITTAAILEETIADRIPKAAHSAWLGTSPGDLVKQVRQRFVSPSSQLVMLSEVSYPRDRYDAFTFRMSLDH